MGQGLSMGNLGAVTQPLRNPPPATGAIGDEFASFMGVRPFTQEWRHDEDVVSTHPSSTAWDSGLADMLLQPLGS